MLIFDANNKPIILESIHVPITTDYMWILDLNILDFKLAPLTILEEIICPSLQVQINGFEFILPASWSILVCDRDTLQLDIVELAAAAGKEFTALIYGPKRTSPYFTTISVTNYFLEQKNVGPYLNKYQMLCHPVGPGEWVCISPSDVYNKYLKGCTIGDII